MELENRKEILTFEIIVTGSEKVKGQTGQGEMIYFEGSANCDNFKGIVLPGGVDTQKEQYGGQRTLSARYILEGMDRDGEKCRIFIENNGMVPQDGSEMITTPKIYTDSKALAYLETVELKGTLTPTAQGVTIHIFA